MAFTTADQFALSGQARTLHGTAARLIVTLLAALCLAFAPLWMTSVAWQDARHGIEVFGLIAAALFLAALLYELWLIKTRPERDWYDGRAVAESVKTLSWRYAVGGHPYPRGGGTESAFMHDLRSLGIDIAPLRQALESGGRPTPWMTRLRASSLADRQNAYIVQRVRDQEAWYARKARYNVTQARRWSRALLTFEALAVGFALVKALGLVELDLASFAAAAIAGGAAWLALKQHESVAAAYTLAALELASVHRRLKVIDSETAWADEVAGAEEAVSREHTMWRASRSKSEPESITSDNSEQVEP